MIDFHCHIDLFQNPLDVLAGVEARGVHVLAVTTTPKAWRGTRKLIGDRARVRIGLGLHPELVPERHGEVALFAHLLTEARYVGEIGLDGSPHMRGSFALQDATLRRMLGHCADFGGRVMSLHSRRAASGVLDALEANPDAGTPVMHWFSGTGRELDRAISLGCWFSVGPNMLNGIRGRALAAAMPRDRVLTETDAPFAASKGGPLMPWDAWLALPVLAELWSCDIDQVAEQLTRNLRVLGERASNRSETKLARV